MPGLRSAVAGAAIIAVCATAARADDQVARGKYLVTLMGCGDCHTPGYFLGKPDLAHPLSGSDIGFFVPGVGVRWGPNLTPDPQTGLGTWSDADVIRALRTGVTPGGRRLIPAMPYESFAALTDADAAAIVAYLRSLPPVRHAVPAPVGPDEKPSAGYLTVVMPQTP